MPSFVDPVKQPAGRSTLQSTRFPGRLSSETGNSAYHKPGAPESIRVPARLRTVRTSAPVNWEQIYTECHPALIEMATRCVCGRPDREASDMVNEAFLAVLSDPPSVETDWRVFLTELIVEMSAEESDPPRTDGMDHGMDHDPVEPELAEDTAAIAVRRVAAAEVRQRILRVMGYMTERQRQITRLRLFEGLSVGEIATVMNTSSSNISQIVIRCLTKLQPVLTQFDTFDQRDLERVRPPRRAVH